MNGSSRKIGTQQGGDDRDDAACRAHGRATLAQHADRVAGGDDGLDALARRARGCGSRARARPRSRARGGPGPRARATTSTRLAPYSATRPAAAPARPGGRPCGSTAPAAGRPRSRGGGRSRPAGRRRRCRRESTATSCRSRRAVHLAAQQRGHADRAGALDHELGALEQQDHGVGDVVLGHDDDVVDASASQQRRVSCARLLDGDAVGDGQAAGRVHRLAARAATPAPARTPRPARRRPGPRAARDLTRDGHAAGQPAAADGHDRPRRGRATSSSSSSPSVPWPATTSGSSKGWTKASPASAARSRAAATASSTTSPPRRAPSRRARGAPRPSRSARWRA